MEKQPDQPVSDLVFEITGGEPVTRGIIPLVAADAGRIKNVNQHGIRQITGLKSDGDQQITVSVNFDRQERRLEVFALDASGKAHMSVQGSYLQSMAELTYPVPIADLRGLAVKSKLTSNVHFRNLSLQPGHRTQVTIEGDLLSADAGSPVTPKP